MPAGRGARAVLTIAVVALLAWGAGFLAAKASAEAPGGIGATYATESAAGGAAHTAALVDGRAIPPLDAPPAVKRAIRAANHIRATPYVWGGGHRGWYSRGYDCSGSVSYALHGGGLLDTPLVSGSFASWGAAGPGRWITIYANSGHVYAVIAGLRWDTSGDAHGTGPRWHAEPPYPRGFVVRHPIGY